MPVETPDTFPALFWAYTSVWCIICVYVWTLGCRLKKLEKNQMHTKRDQNNA
jgi:CcmD family protein